jgi:aminoglycoside phosphotransferase (APT) family kinase protein
MLNDPDGRALTSSAIGWVERCLGSGSSVVDATRLGGATGPWLLAVRNQRGIETVVLRDGDPEHATEQARFEVEAAALRVAEDLRIIAPRLIGQDLSGAEASRLAILSTHLTGANLIPQEVTHERLLALGRAVASLCRTPPSDTPLPVRPRPLSDLDFASERAAGVSTPILDEADRFIASGPPPHGGNVLVHGDCWQGNTVWSDDRFMGFVDWDAAGFGQPGLDLGSIRFDVALYFGLDGLDAVTEGWRQAGGPPIDQLAYWDVLAALSSPADLSPWMPTITGPGRADLDVRTVTARRDDFIRAALRRAGR